MIHEAKNAVPHTEKKGRLSCQCRQESHAAVIPTSAELLRLSIFSIMWRLLRWPVAKSPRPLGHRLRCNRHNVDRYRIELRGALVAIDELSCSEMTYPHALQHITRLLIHVQLPTFTVLRKVQSGDLGHVLILALTFFFL